MGSSTTNKDSAGVAVNIPRRISRSTVWNNLSFKAWLGVFTFTFWAITTFMIERTQLVGVRVTHRATRTVELGPVAANDEPALSRTSGALGVPDFGKPAKIPPIHILYCLSGNHSGFIAEFEVSMKSAMMNAPIDRDLIIHILADGLAYDALDEVFERSEIKKWEGRNRISIRSYNIESHVPAWKAKVEGLLRSTGFNLIPTGQAFGIHTIGCWFRLLCNQVLPTIGNGDDDSVDAVEHVLYMDPDVVVMANLEELWRHADSQYQFQWGEMACSGFVLLNVPKLDEVWQIAETLPLFNISKTTDQAPNDQLVFRAVHSASQERLSSNQTTPSQDRGVQANVGVLPEEWDNSVAAGMWRFRKNLVSQRPQLGMLHFNGGGASKDSYFQQMPDFLDEELVQGTFGLAKYFIYMPWIWARFNAASLISGEKTPNGERPRGVPLELLHRKDSFSGVGVA